MKRKSTSFLFFIIFAFISSCRTETGVAQKPLQIHDLQGCSHVSPFLGKIVNKITGVVTYKESNGFTMQSIEEDEFSCSSEAIFVFTEDFPEVMRGDMVEVSGLVQEFRAGDEDDYNLSKTEIIKPIFRIIDNDRDLPETIILDEQVDIIPREIVEDDAKSSFDHETDGLDYFEGLESMLVQINNGIVVAPKNEYDEIVIVPEKFHEFNLISNAGAMLVTQQDRNPDKFMVKLPVSFENNVYVGDKLTGDLIGIMDYSFGNYKIICINTPEFLPGKVNVPEIPKYTEGLTIATYNLENLSPFDADLRFKDFAKQIVNNLNSPDILVLHEIMDSSGSEDDGTVEALITLQKLQKEIVENGGPHYQFSDSVPQNNQDGGMQGANIRSVLFYREDKGISLAKTQNEVVEGKFVGTRMSVHDNPIRIGEFEKVFIGTRKPALWLLDFEDLQFVIIGFHLVSQNLNSPEWGEVQPMIKPESDKRIAQAAIIHDVAAEILTQHPHMPVFLAGDLNDLPWSESAIKMAGSEFVNAGELDSPNEQFSYIFEGSAQQLDYIFINKNLVNNIEIAKFLHLNTILDHTEQISDHDPFFLAFGLLPD